MEGIIELEGPTPDDIASRSEDKVDEKASTVNEPQGYEWIPHDDAGARKRARAHVTRGFRRKAVQTQLLLKNTGSQAAKPPKRSPNVEVKEKVITKIAKGIRAPQPRVVGEVDEAIGKVLLQGMILQQTLGSDPYAVFPVKLCPNKRQLMDHFFFGQGPLSFVGDNRADFQPITKLVFDVGLYGASGFHAIMATAANHVAAARETRISEDGLIHQQTAISLVNKMLSVWRPESLSESLVSVTLLAMLEVGYVLTWDTGIPLSDIVLSLCTGLRRISTHTAIDKVDGLSMMLKLGGGLESLREKDFPVYSFIHWFDYAGSCNIVSRRRFETAQYSDQLRSSPEGVPPKFLELLPASYDLLQELMRTFDRLHTMTTVVWAAEVTEEQRLEVFDAVKRTDTALYQSICIPETEFNRSRRRHLYESLCLLTLVYTSLVSEYEGPQTELFIYRFENIWTDEGCEWGGIVVGIFRSILVGEGYHLESFMDQVLSLVDVSTRLAWAGFRHIRDLLMDFFAWDPACHGQLQDLWKERMEKISPGKGMDRIAIRAKSGEDVLDRLDSGSDDVISPSVNRKKNVSRQ